MTYLHPEEFEAKRFTMTCRPAPLGGYEVNIVRGTEKTHTNHFVLHAGDIADIVSEELVRFYLGAKAEDARIVGESRKKVKENA